MRIPRFGLILRSLCLLLFIFQLRYELQHQMESSNPDKTRQTPFLRIWWPALLALLSLLSLQTYFVLRWFGGTRSSSETLAQQSPSPSRVAFQGHSYEIFRHKRTWDESKRLCEAMGGHLVTITSESEQEFVLALLRQTPHLPFSSCWLGGTDRRTPGDWQWTTGEELALTKYLELDGGTEHWLALRLDTGKWDDYSDKGENFGEQWFMCEWEK